MTSKFNEEFAAGLEEEHPLPLDDYVSIEGAAAILDVSASTLERRIRHGDLTVRWWRGRRLIERNSIGSYQAARMNRKGGGTRA
jgi:hypothetical protein